MQKILLYLISFSTGALLGDVFLHMLPEMIGENGFPVSLSFLILAGILASFILEKFIHWRHCHVVPSSHHHHPVGIMNIVGDGIHNAMDGILIAGSFLVDTQIGIATTVAVLLHEIPQEISDFAILVYSGFSRKKALLLNALSGVAAIVGAVLVLLFHTTIPSLTAILLPLTAGNFLYIAGSDLIPELHKETGTKRSIGQFLCILAGIGFMASLLYME